MNTIGNFTRNGNGILVGIVLFITSWTIIIPILMFVSMFMVENTKPERSLGRKIISAIFWWWSIIGILVWIARNYYSKFN